MGAAAAAAPGIHHVETRKSRIEEGLTPVAATSTATYSCFSSVAAADERRRAEGSRWRSFLLCVVVVLLATGRRTDVVALAQPTKKSHVGQL